MMNDMNAETSAKTEVLTPQLVHAVAQELRLADYLDEHSYPVCATCRDK